MAERTHSTWIKSTHQKKIRELLFVAVLTATTLSGCAPSSEFWSQHPEAFHVGCAFQTLEVILDSPRDSESPARAYVFSIQLQNNSGRWMRFSHYDSGKWIGEGLTLTIDSHFEENIGTLSVDLRPLSNTLLGPKGETKRNQSPRLVFVPYPNAFARERVRQSRAKLTIIWGLQDRHGQSLPIVRRATIVPTLALIDLIAPRVVAVEASDGQ
jgi:hypothetical protein